MNQPEFSRPPTGPTDISGLYSYYDRNRKIGNSIDEMFDSLHCELSLNSDHIARLPDEKIKDMVKHSLASMIAEELVKNDKIVIVEQDGYFGEARYRCEIPFLKSKYIKELSNEVN